MKTVPVGGPVGCHASLLGQTEGNLEGAYGAHGSIMAPPVFSLSLPLRLPVNRQDVFEFTEVQEDGSTEPRFGLVEESLVSSAVRIKCLSFDPEKDGCASDPCG